MNTHMGSRPRRTPAPTPHPVTTIATHTYHPNPPPPTLPQVSPMDCTGCELCVHACPDNALTSTPAAAMLATETPNWEYFLKLPNR